MLAEVDQSQICSPTSPWPLNSGGAMNSGGAIEVAIEAALSALLVVLERRPDLVARFRAILVAEDRLHVAPVFASVEQYAIHRNVFGC